MVLLYYSPNKLIPSGTFLARRTLVTTFPIFTLISSTLIEAFLASSNSFIAMDLVASSMSLLGGSRVHATLTWKA